MQDFEIATPRRPRDHSRGVMPVPTGFWCRGERVRKGREVFPAALQVSELRHWLHLDEVVVEERVSQGFERHGVHTARSSEVDQRRAPVVAPDAEVPEVVQEIGVVGVAKEGLRVRNNLFGVKVREHGDLVGATDDREQSLDVGVREGGVQITGAFLRCCTYLTSRWKLHWYETKLVAQHAHPDFVNLGEDARARPRRRDHGYLV